jgi:hypothetical protein
MLLEVKSVMPKKGTLSTISVNNLFIVLTERLKVYPSIRFLNCEGEGRYCKEEFEAIPDTLLLIFCAVQRTNCIACTLHLSQLCFRTA